MIYLLLLLAVFIFYFLKLHIHIDLRSFLRKGFAKIDNYFGLYCYTGKQGEGKTYSVINFLIKNKLQHNYIIITNVKSFNIFKDTIYLTDINDIIDLVVNNKDKNKKYIIFFDEIFTILEKKAAINNKILSFISQLRKRNIIFLTTAQEWSEINITFRRYVRFQVACHMFSIPFFKTAFLINRINDGDNIRWNNDLQEFEAPTIRTVFMKGNKRIIEAYDTFETIKTS